MPANDPYADIVTLYDLEHDDFTDDIEFLLELATYGDGPILELGCGTGRVLAPLAEAGHTVVGIDRSEPMLDVTRKRLDAHPNAHLLSGDMSDLQAVPGGPFGLIISSLNSIMHLTDSGQQRAMIDSAFDVLQPGGRLVIDTLNPSVAQLNHLLNTTHLEGSWQTADGTMIDKWGHRQFGEESQVIETLIWYDQTSTTGELRRTRTRFDLRFVHQSELALMLEMAGFPVVDWYGTYDLDPWYAGADRIIAIAHKDEE